MVDALDEYPWDATVESQPNSPVEAGATASYTMKSTAVDGFEVTTQGSNVFKVTATCNDSSKCGASFYTATSTYDANGVHSADLVATQWGTYDVVVTMTNAYTAANPTASTTVSSGMSLTIFDDTTVPSASTVLSSPSSDVEAGSNASYSFQSRSKDERNQPESGDVYTVTATCNNSTKCGSNFYTATATHDGSGVYSANLVAT